MKDAGRTEPGASISKGYFQMILSVARGLGAHVTRGAVFASVLVGLLNIEPARATVVTVQFSGVVTSAENNGSIITTSNSSLVGLGVTSTYIFATGGANESGTQPGQDVISFSPTTPALAAYVTIGQSTLGINATEGGASESSAQAKNASLGNLSVDVGGVTSPTGEQDLLIQSDIFTNNLFPQTPANFNLPLSYTVQPGDSAGGFFFLNGPPVGQFSINSVTVTPNTSAQVLNQQGGTVSAPTNLAGPDIVQLNGAIGGQGTGQFYNFDWAGGQLIASADVNGADPLASYAFEILGLDGTVRETIELNAGDNFFGLLGDQLAAGDYEIGLLSDSAVDPSYSITFGTPVDGVGTGVAAVPEPASLALFGAGVLAFGFLRRRRMA